MLTDAQRQQGTQSIQERLNAWIIDLAHKERGAVMPLPRSPLMQSIAAFWPLSQEPDLRPLFIQWYQTGLTIALPVLGARNQPFEFHRWSPQDPMRVGRYGILEPTHSPLIIPNLILVPTLGYTRQADRLGYGKGYYDRTLAALKNAGHRFTTIGIAWACCQINTPYQPFSHDVGLDAILTPDGWFPHAPIV